MQACIDRALESNGYRDREMIFRHSGFLPSPGASSIHVFNSAPFRTVTGEDAGVPSFEEFAKQLAQCDQDANGEDLSARPAPKAP